MEMKSSLNYSLKWAAAILLFCGSARVSAIMAIATCRDSFDWKNQLLEKNDELEKELESGGQFAMFTHPEFKALFDLSAEQRIEILFSQPNLRDGFLNLKVVTPNSGQSGERDSSILKTE